MAAPILSRARLLELSPAERRAEIERTAREIDTEIEQLKAGEIRIMYGRSRRYHLQLLYARRQQLVELAREAGCGSFRPVLTLP